WSYPALAVGKSYVDSTMGFTVAPLSVTSAGASVQVTYGPVTCTHVNPSVSTTGPSGSVAPGVTANVTVTVTNNDTSACSSSQFALNDSVPSGWTAAYNTSSITLSPGTSGSVTLQVTAPGGTANGTYSVAASAYNAAAPSYTASATLSLTVYTPPPATISISTDQTSYNPGQKVSSTVTV